MADSEKNRNGSIGDLTPPEQSSGDAIHTLARAGISAIPVISGPAVELFQMLVRPPLEKRQQEWMEAVAEALKLLEEKQKCVLEDLKGNDAFIDTTLQASQAATRTAKQEKREALRNAVLNAACPNPPEESKQQIFINLVDQFTVWHLRILVLFANPKKWFMENNIPIPETSLPGSTSQMLVRAYPELNDKRDLYDLIGKDLHQQGLIGTDSFHTTMSGHGMMAKRTTDLGDEFIRFISEPQDAIFN